jgi:hypothetical protein
MEYEVYLLDDKYQLCHKGEAIIATDNLAVACTYVYEYYNKYQIPICVYQPRHGHYRETYAPWITEEDKMALPKEVKMTRDGGNFWRAMTFRYAVTYAIILPVIFMVIIAVINPLWFRDSFFRWVENSVNKITRWRNYRTYALYLGADPEMWHTLKDNVE